MVLLARHVAGLGGDVAELLLLLSTHGEARSERRPDRRGKDVADEGIAVVHLLGAPANLARRLLGSARHRLALLAPDDPA